jgi:hypothetical protein
MGLASLADLEARKRRKETAPRTPFWQMLKSLFEQPDQSDSAPAVCIPPGAQLIVRNIPTDLQRRCGLGVEEGASFTQISAEINHYRDALLFHGRSEVLLQDLREGMRVRILSLASMEEYAPALKVGSMV